MNPREEIIFDLEELEDPLRLAKVAVRRGYLTAAIHYLEDIESEAKRLILKVRELQGTAPTKIPNLHPNDPAFVPSEE